MTVLLFLWNAYCVGAGMTAIALAVRALVSSFRYAKDVMRAAELGLPEPISPPILPPGRLDAIGLWPLFLWRPWEVD